MVPLKFTSRVEQGDQVLTDVATVQAGMVAEIAETIPEDSSNLPFALAFAYAKLKAIVLRASAKLTIKINSSGEPDLTITLEAGGRFQWFDGCGLDNPFDDVDVTEIFVTSGASGTGDESELTGFVAVDPT